MDDKLQEIIALNESGYRATAMRELTAALRQHPDHAEGWYWLARLSEKPRRQKAAIDRALTLKPDYPQAIEFRAALLTEYPWLAGTGRFQREFRIAALSFLAALLLIGISVIAFVLLSGEEAPQEVIIVIPTTQAPTEQPTTFIIVTNTPTPPIVTPLVAPTVAAIPPTEAAPSPPPQSIAPDFAANLRVMVAESPDSEAIVSRLQSRYPNLSIEIAPDSITTPTDAARLVAESAAGLVIYREGENWRLYAQEGPNQISAAGLGLDRLPNPWELTLNASDPNSSTSLEAAVGYLANDYSGVIEGLAPLFQTPRSRLDENGARLAFMLAYSHQVIGDSNEALRLLDMLNTDPPPYIAANRAFAIGQTGDFDSASRLLEALMGVHPQPAHLQTALALLAQVDNPDLALSALQNALAQNADYLPAQYALARLHMRRGDWESARALLVEMNDIPDALADLALVYFQLGNVNELRAAAESALRLDPANPTAHLALGQAYLLQNEPTLARDSFSRALEYQPSNPALWVARCAANARLGDDGAAAADCDNALALDPRNGPALEQRGMIRYRAGDRAGAEQDFIEAITYAPEAVYEAHYHLGFFALQERRLADAIGQLSAALDIAPYLGHAYATRGVAYRLTGAWEAAISDLERALTLMPEEVYSYYELGLANRALADLTFEAGDQAGAVMLYRAAQEAFTAFLNASQPEDAYVAEALAGLNYVTQALAVIGQ